ncbi:MAG TPA: GNAT family protein [Verrucomicrobiae bacterium]|nr:GNAT family protein [Verrucomicrobiae bacterium]
MDHSLRIEDFSVRLRPVRMEDAAFIVWLRNLDHARGRVGDSAGDVTSQESWLRKYFDRAGDYYFIIESEGGIPVGAYGIYDMTGSSAESGRWIVRADVPAGIPSAILAFDLAFERLGLKELRVTTVSTNQPVLSLNRKFGFRQVRIEHAARLIAGKPVDLVHFLLSAEEWGEPRSRLLPMARLAGAQVRDWELAQLETRDSFEPGNSIN